jgi:hypothetical protein
MIGTRACVPALVRVRTRVLVVALLASLALALIASAAVPAPAAADSTEQSILIDDSAVLYDTPAQMQQAMTQIASLGVNVIKVSMVWALVAPDETSLTKPNFNATDPNSYPHGAWDRYDSIVELAHSLGLTVYFQLTGQAPLWATNPAPLKKNEGYPWSHEPNPQDFEQFAQAVGTRYSGSFVPTQPDIDPSLSAFEPAAGQPLPAVNWWGIWNEPNEVGWLSPQTRAYNGHTVPFSPYWERQLTDAGYVGLLTSGHADDTILIGETASGGNTRVLPFVRAMYCVGSNLKPLTGKAASALECPTSGNRQSFVTANPGLFAIAGWAHHPYSFDHVPNTPFAGSPDVITLANLGKLERTLDGIFRTYGEPSGLPLYLTEWGYKTNPPNPYVHTSLTQQATWLNEGEYMTYHDSQVKALAQFLLWDNPPRAGSKVGSLSYWSTFQTGLEYVNETPKPGYYAFQLPLWLPSAKTGQNVTVWGELRPAPQLAGGGAQYGLVEEQPKGSTSWNWLRVVTTTNSEGFFQIQMPITQAGNVRLVWQDTQNGQVDYSRTVAVS